MKFTTARRFSRTLGPAASWSRLPAESWVSSVRPAGVKGVRVSGTRSRAAEGVCTVRICGCRRRASSSAAGADKPCGFVQHVGVLESVAAYSFQFRPLPQAASASSFRSPIGSFLEAAFLLQHRKSRHPVDDTNPASPNTILPQFLGFWYVLVYEDMQDSIIHSLCSVPAGSFNHPGTGPWTPSLRASLERAMPAAVSLTLAR